jgi:hypothetical protein
MRQYYDAFLWGATSAKYVGMNVELIKAFVGHKKLRQTEK